MNLLGRINTVKMGTPIRRILHPSIVSPLSPAFRSRQIPENTRGTGSPINEKYLRAKNIGKALNFQVPPLSKNYSPFRSSTSNLSCTTELNKPCNVKVEVKDYSNGFLILNTPNKNNLLKNGPYCTRDLNILGKGSFGVVVRGIYKGADVAVKITKLCKSTSSLREENAINFTHENVVKIVDIIISGKTNYGIVLMEYLKFSRHLQSILDDQNWPLNLQIIATYALDICKGLQYCHQNKVLHLDLKPSNVLVCEDRLCKLCDFGNSVKLNDINEQESYQGTVAYTAPEILLGKPPTSASDVYSLGILLWQMRYREIPYSDLDGVEVIIYKVVKFGYRPVSVSTSIQTIQDDYFIIYSNCWAPNAADRPDISSIIKMLAVLLN